MPSRLFATYMVSNSRTWIANERGGCRPHGPIAILLAQFETAFT